MKKQNPSLKEFRLSLSVEGLAKRGRVTFDGGLVFLLDRGRSYLNRIEAVINLFVSVAVNVDFAVFADTIHMESRRALGIRESAGISLVPALADESVIYHGVKVLKGLIALPLYIISNGVLILGHKLSRAWLKIRTNCQKVSLLDAQQSRKTGVAIILHRATRSVMPAIDYPQENLAIIS